MSYKNTISIGKTIDVLNTISMGKTIMGKTIDVIEKYDIYWKNHRYHIQLRCHMSKTIDVLKDIYGQNH